MKSISPRTALTGVPSGAPHESGTPKKARKYIEAVSSSISRFVRRCVRWRHASHPATPNSLGSSGVEEIDRKILTLLAADGRMSFTDLGKATGLSTSAVHQRVKRLEQRGQILAYGATIDHDQLGLPLTAFVSITPIDASPARRLSRAVA